MLVRILIVICIFFYCSQALKCQLPVGQFFKGVLVQEPLPHLPKVDTLNLMPWEQIGDNHWLSYQNNRRTIWVQFLANQYGNKSILPNEITYIYFGNKYQDIHEFRLDQNGNLSQVSQPSSKPSQFHFVIDTQAVAYFAIVPSPYRTKLTAPIVQTKTNWIETRYQFILDHKVQIIFWYALVAVLAFGTILCLIQYLVLRDKNGFLFYSFFLFTQLLNFYSRRLDYLFESTDILYFLTTHGNQISTYLGHSFYFFYGCNFLHLELHHPRLRKFLLICCWILFICLFVHFLLFYGFERQDLALQFYYQTRIVLGVLVGMTIIAVAMKKIPYKRFFLFGTLIVFITSLFWLWFGISKLPSNYYPVHPGLIYYMAVGLQTAIFLAGLSYRLRETELAKQTALLQLATDRQRISRDLHDHMATQLAAYSIRLRNFFASFGKKTEEQELLTSGLTELNAQMRDIIWMTSDTPQSVQQLITKLQEYLHLVSNPIVKVMNIQAEPETLTLVLPAKMNHDIFVILKEAIFNIYKYAQATEVHITISMTKLGLNIEVRDNGIGFDTTQASSGYGLRNMAERVESHGGKFILTSMPKQGSSLKLYLPFPKVTVF